MRRLGAEPLEPLGLGQIVDQLRDLALGALLASDIVEGHGRGRLVLLALGRSLEELLEAALAAEPARDVLPHAPGKPDVEPDQQQPRHDAEQDAGTGGLALAGRKLVGRVGGIELVEETGILEWRDADGELLGHRGGGAERPLLEELAARDGVGELDMGHGALGDELAEIGIGDLRRPARPRGVARHEEG